MRNCIYSAVIEQRVPGSLASNRRVATPLNRIIEDWPVVPSIRTRCFNTKRIKAVDVRSEPACHHSDGQVRLVFC